MEARTRPSKKPRRSAGDGLTAFALRLAKHFGASEVDADGGRKNLIFSPLTIYTALALVAAGARRTTLDELLALLGVASREELAEFVRGVVESVLTDKSETGGPLIASASGVWHEKTLALKPAYREVAVESYKAETRAVDFLKKAEEARAEINNWVAEATNKLITSIIPPRTVHSSTCLVLANAIYFKGVWERPFTKEHTKDDKFYRIDGAAVHVPFMHSGGYEFVAEHDGFKVLKLPYQVHYRTTSDSNDEGVNRYNKRGRTTSDSNDEGVNRYNKRGRGVLLPLFPVEKKSDSDDGYPRFSMCIFLPDAHNGLPSLVDKMASSPGFLHDHLPRRSVEVGKFKLPKFKLSFSCEINGVLQDLGLKAAFNLDKADLSGMVEGGSPLALEHVFHKAVVEVNEEGTEAAAFTAALVQFCCYREPMDFVADHPFAFFVVEWRHPVRWSSWGTSSTLRYLSNFWGSPVRIIPIPPSLVLCGIHFILEEASGAVVFTGHVLGPSIS